jgi:hypothetical protein
MHTLGRRGTPSPPVAHRCDCGHTSTDRIGRPARTLAVRTYRPIDRPCRARAPPCLIHAGSTSRILKTSSTRTQTRAAVQRFDHSRTPACPLTHSSTHPTNPMCKQPRGPLPCTTAADRPMHRFSRQNQTTSLLTSLFMSPASDAATAHNRKVSRGRAACEGSTPPWTP